MSPRCRSAAQRLIAMLVLGVLAALVPALPASAATPTLAPAKVTAAFHPLGNFTVNRYDGLVVAPGEVRIDHVQDLAEIPTAQAKPRLDAEGLTAWAGRRCREAAASMRISADGRPLTFAARSATAQLRPGQAGLPTLRVECDLVAPASGGASIVFRDEGAAGTVGWHEITARGDRMTLTGADVPSASRSDRLTSYPSDMLSAPLDQRAADLRVRSGGPALEARRSPAPGAGVLPRGADGLTRAFTDLVAQRRFTVGFAAVALLIALALGALHALAPGHGKTIMAAYAAGHGRRARRDVFTLGVTVTATHTVGVLMLGLLVASGTALAAGAVYAWLGIASGALVAAVGVTLLRRAVRTVRAPDREHGHGHAHTHDQHVTAVPRRGGAALMGFAGGLVPSPSAVLVLVGAAAIGRAWFGVVLVLAYGAGLALTLILIGLLVVGSGRALGRRLREFTDGPWPVRRMAILLSGRRRALLPLGSSAAVVMLGLGLVLRSLPAAIG